MKLQVKFNSGAIRVKAKKLRITQDGGLVEIVLLFKFDNLNAKSRRIMPWHEPALSTILKRYKMMAYRLFNIFFLNKEELRRLMS